MVKITATGTWLRFFFAMFSTSELKWSNTQPHKRLVFFLLVPVLHRRHEPQAWRPVPNKLSLGGGAWDKAIRVLETWSLVAKLGRTEAVLWAPFAILGRFGCGREGGYQHLPAMHAKQRTATVLILSTFLYNQQLQLTTPQAGLQLRRFRAIRDGESRAPIWYNHHHHGLPTLHNVHCVVWRNETTLVFF